MRSHLTRRVFRRLISNEPVTQKCQCHTRNIHRQCIRGADSRPSLRSSQRLLVNYHVPRRTLFGIWETQDRETVGVNLDPGMDKMLELDKRIHLNARWPSTEELLNAFKKFFKAKADKNRIIEDFHAILLLQTFRSIQAQRAAKPELDLKKTSYAALKTLAYSHSSLTDIHVQLAEALYLELRDNNPDNENSRVSNPALLQSLHQYIFILCNAGQTLKARDELERTCQADPAISGSVVGDWARILHGFTQENNKVEFQATLELMNRYEVQYNQLIHTALAVFSAKRDDVENTKKWFSYLNERIRVSGSDDQRLGVSIYQEILEFCIRNGEMEWGQSVLSGCDDELPNQREWDAMFVAAAATGKSVEEINRMISVVVRRTQEANADSAEKTQLPDIGIFNSLIRYAISKNDSYTAERYFQLLEKWKAVPNATTFILQMEYRLAVEDLDGAMAAYSELKGFEVENGADWPVMNKLFQQLVSSPRAKEKYITRVREDITARKRVIFSPTILALCKYHLGKDEYFEIADLLHTYAFQFSISQRTEIRDVLSSYTLDPSTETRRAWDSYMIFHQIFDIETKRDVYSEVMTSFFGRGRDDLAMHVFMRMSKHVRADTRPDIDTYTRAFEGIAANASFESLRQVHNLLKLDTENEPCTKVLNALMLAYTACEEPLTSLEIWQDIATSDEGPDLNSINIALQACEKAPFGHEIAEHIWDKLQKTNVVIDKTTMTNYLAVLVASQLFDEAKVNISKMREITGQDPNAIVMATLFNACMNIKDQEDVVDFLIKKDYPHLWAELEQRGFEENELGLPRVKGIDRTLKA